MRQDCIHFYDKIVWDRTASIFWQDGMRQDCIHFYDKIVWDRTASIFMTRWHETGLHPFLWQDCMRQDCIHFYDKMAWDRTASILMTRLYETGLHPFLWQDGMRQDCIHFYDKIVWDRHSSIFMTSQHKTGTHPFYIGMYIHIYTHIYVHIYTSQKECLHIFPWKDDDWKDDWNPLKNWSLLNGVYVKLRGLVFHCTLRITLKLFHPPKQRWLTLQHYESTPRKDRGESNSVPWNIHCKHKKP